ncbi:hypothetical protein DsansV1_C06g0061071 [Dioscorea sansibarensis]
MEKETEILQQSSEQLVQESLFHSQINVEQELPTFLISLSTEGETEAKEDGLRSCSSPSLSWIVGASAPSELASDLSLVVRR